MHTFRRAPPRFLALFASARALQFGRRMKTNISSLVLAFVLTGGVLPRAFAQVAPGPAAQAATTATPASVSASSADPNLDRGFILPTAMTQPAGTATYNNYELVLHGVSYGVTNNLQASITVLSPIVKDMPFVGFVSLKGHIPVGARLHLALQGSAGYGHFAADATDASLYSIGAGAFASVCLRDDCSSLLSGSGTYQLALNDSGDRGHFVVYGGSIVHRVTTHLKLLGEVTSAAGGSSAGGLDNIPGVL